MDFAEEEVEEDGEEPEDDVVYPGIHPFVIAGARHGGGRICGVLSRRFELDVNSRASTEEVRSGW